MDNIVDNSKYYSIAVDAPLWPDHWTYKSQESFEPGDIVELPFGKRKSTGVVIQKELTPIESQFEIKDFQKKIDHWKNLSQLELKLYQWTAKYYQYPLGKLIFDSLPNSTKSVNKIKPIVNKLKSWPFKNSQEMNEIIQKLENQLHLGFSQHLLHGVTGSGKSLIYLQLIKKILEKNKSVLYLVPEINLTPQFVDFFSHYLDTEIFQFHSQVSVGQRYALYHYVKETTKPVLVISARSGIFLPIENLGGIIIDEEHDQSYKQDDRCKYHARDVAIYKAKLHNAPILMGSATPSTESYRRFHEVDDLKQNYYQLKNRYHNQSLASFEKITEPHYTEKSWPLSESVIQKIQVTCEQPDSQVLIFVNKLGFARYIQCKSCHQDFSCPNCSVKLTYFKKRQSIECHLCDYQTKVPESCPKCGCLDLFSQGFGVEKVVEKLADYFAKETILRIDRDEAKTLNSAKERFETFHRGEFKILVGTQMITKGHNFKNIKLVVVLGIDAQLHTSEFRAKERIYQLLNQVAGRAGREGDASEILVQTNLADQELQDLMSTDMDKFYQDELKIRKMVNYPPYRKLVQITLRGQNAQKIHFELEKIKLRLEQTIKGHRLAVDIKGPRVASLEKIKNKFGETLILLSEQAELFSPLLKQLHLETKLLKKMELSINVDPQYLE
jgi:primosomal protein N' (replication factor Y)